MSHFWSTFGPHGVYLHSGKFFFIVGDPMGQLSPITFLSNLGAITIITIRDSLTLQRGQRVFVNLGGTCFYKAVTLASHQSDDLAAALAREIISYRKPWYASFLIIFVALLCCFLLLYSIVIVFLYHCSHCAPWSTRSFAKTILGHCAPRSLRFGNFTPLFLCSFVEEVPAAVGETNLLDKGADTRLNCQTALQTMSKIIL